MLAEDAGGDARRRRQAAAADAGAALRGPAAGDVGAFAPRPPSSSSTWRRSSTTTSSTARRCAAAIRPWSPASGRERAIATGDLLFSRAFAELRDQRRRAPGRTAQRRLGGAGASASWPSAATPSTPRSAAERYLERCRLKTARLFECACLIGSVGQDPGDGGPSRDTEGLAVFGREIGLAFQLLDDVLDVTGPPERTGKARGTDLLDGTVTLPLILARERDPSLGDIDLRALDAESAAAICDRIAATGALDRRPRAGAGARGRGEGWSRRSCDGRRRAAAARRSSPTGSSSATLVGPRSPRAGRGRREARRRSGRPRSSMFARVRSAEVVEHRRGAGVELDRRSDRGPPAVDAAAVPLALGAAQVHGPARRARPAPSRVG